MGMYTELVCAFELEKSVPINVIEILRYMTDTNDKYEDPPLPDHPLFQTTRWRFMLTSDSYYFPGITYSLLEYDDIAGRWSLTVKCNLKNYDDEIQKFIDWIQPYMYTDGFFGYMRYEEASEPTCLYHN